MGASFTVFRVTTKLEKVLSLVSTVSIVTTQCEYLHRVSRACTVHAEIQRAGTDLWHIFTTVLRWFSVSTQSQYPNAIAVTTLICARSKSWTEVVDCTFQLYLLEISVTKLLPGWLTRLPIKLCCFTILRECIPFATYVKMHKSGNIEFCSGSQQHLLVQTCLKCLCTHAQLTLGICRNMQYIGNLRLRSELSHVLRMSDSLCAGTHFGSWQEETQRTPFTSGTMDVQWSFGFPLLKFHIFNGEALLSTGAWYNSTGEISALQ